MMKSEVHTLYIAVSEFRSNREKGIVETARCYNEQGSQIKHRRFPFNYFGTTHQGCLELMLTSIQSEFYHLLFRSPLDSKPGQSSRIPEWRRRSGFLSERACQLRRSSRHLKKPSVLGGIPKSKASVLSRFRPR